MCDQSVLSLISLSFSHCSMLGSTILWLDRMWRGDHNNRRRGWVVVCYADAATARRRQPRPSERPLPQPTALKVMELWKNARLWLPNTALQKQNRAWAVFMPYYCFAITRVYSDWINWHFSVDIGKQVPTKVWLPEPGNSKKMKAFLKHISHSVVLMFFSPNFRLKN